MLNKEDLKKLSLSTPQYQDIVNIKMQTLLNQAIHQQSATIQQSLPSFQSNYLNQVNIIGQQFLESIKPSSLLKDIFDRINEWDDSAKREAYKICKKYNYFISPSIPEEFRYYLIDEYTKNAKKKTVEKEFYKIYKKNNWKALDFYKEWKNNKFLKKRRLIIKDIVSYVRKTRKPSPRVVLACVISQIDGILAYIYDGMVEKEGLVGTREEKIATILKNDKDLHSSIALDIIANLLFGIAKSGDNPKIGSKSLSNKKHYENLKDNLTGFNRHKILHGEDVDGLTSANMIRAFLLLDFLSSFLIYKKPEGNDLQK